MQPDLRSHLALLEQHGKLVRVSRPVDPGTELAALIIEAERRGQAVLFESVRDSAMPCVANVVGDHAMVGLGLGVPPETAVAAFLERSRRRVPPVVVQNAPAQAHGAKARTRRTRSSSPTRAARQCGTFDRKQFPAAGDQRSSVGAGYAVGRGPGKSPPHRERFAP